eukprot:2730198-Alexandrium_andersonii.AAC.1
MHEDVSGMRPWAFRFSGKTTSHARHHSLQQPTMKPHYPKCTGPRRVQRLFGLAAKSTKVMPSIAAAGTGAPLKATVAEATTGRDVATA